MVYVDYTVFGTSDLFDTFDGATEFDTNSMVRAFMSGVISGAVSVEQIVAWEKADLEGKRLLNPKDTIANDLKLRSEVL